MQFQKPFHEHGVYVPNSQVIREAIPATHSLHISNSGDMNAMSMGFMSLSVGVCAPAHPYSIFQTMSLFHFTNEIPLYVGSKVGNIDV